MKTLQEIYDFSVAHLVKQGKRSFSTDKCMYRSDDGDSCAVGCFISDEDYLPEFDPPQNDSGIHGMLTNSKFATALYNSGVDLKDDKVCELLSNLQIIHDRLNDDDYQNSLSSRLRKLLPTYSK